MDLEIVETLNGGDLLIKNNDLSMIEGLQNMPYIGMFGGNVGHVTKEYKPIEQRFDFWGNTLFSNDKRNIQFNSLTENVLNNIALTSSGRLTLEDSIKSDLSFFSEFSTINVFTQLESVDRIKIFIEIKEPTNTQTNQFVYIWNATKQELINGNNS